MRFEFEMGEVARRRMALALSWGGWWGALILTALDAAKVVPQGLGVVVVLFIGLAIAGSQALSRMRLTETITGVFRAGLQAKRGDDEPASPSAPSDDVTL